MTRRRLITVTALTFVGLMALLCATLVAVAAGSSSPGSPATRLVGNVRQAPPPSSTTTPPPSSPAPAPTVSSSSSTAPPSSTTSTTIYRGASCETSDPALAGDCGTTAADARGWRTADGSACIVTDERTGRAWGLEPDASCAPTPG